MIGDVSLSRLSDTQSICPTLSLGDHEIHSQSLGTVDELSSEKGDPPHFALVNKRLALLVKLSKW